MFTVKIFFVKRYTPDSQQDAFIGRTFKTEGEAMAWIGRKTMPLLLKKGVTGVSLATHYLSVELWQDNKRKYDMTFWLAI